MGIFKFTIFFPSWSDRRERNRGACAERVSDTNPVIFGKSKNSAGNCHILIVPYTYYPGATGGSGTAEPVRSESRIPT